MINNAYIIYIICYIENPQKPDHDNEHTAILKINKDQFIFK